jgi:hypothetical protein
MAHYHVYKMNEWTTLGGIVDGGHFLKTPWGLASGILVFTRANFKQHRPIDWG